MDGRNRFKACEELGVKPEFLEYAGNNPLSDVISWNLKRRHLSESQRAIIAANVLKYQKSIKDEKQIVKNNWIKSARKSFNAGEKQACHVCEKYKSVAHAHHIIPLSIQFDLGFPLPDQSYVWLCPNHHALAHLYIESLVNNIGVSPEGFSPEEKDLIQSVNVDFVNKFC